MISIYLSKFISFDWNDALLPSCNVVCYLLNWISVITLYSRQQSPSQPTQVGSFGLFSFVKTLFRTYFSSMILPPFAATTLMVEENKTIWILEKSKYLRQYTDPWSYQFMQRFIETSMFSVFYLNFFNWKWIVY